MIRAHVNAVKALLTGVNLYMAGEVPDRPSLPYVVLHMDAGRSSVNALDDIATWRDWIFQTTAVGGDDGQARWTAEHVQTALLNTVPVVTGRSCARIKHDLSRGVQPDLDVSPPVLFAVDGWRFASVAA